MSGDDRAFYRGRRVLVTGGDLFNIAGIEDRVRLNPGDVRNESLMDLLVREGFQRTIEFYRANPARYVEAA